ncbi:MAG TPA: polyphosphate kinase 1 [Spirochaetia bacterium]|nr:polyphosphate kinase 1 [Spirochaetia bacterium]
MAEIIRTYKKHEGGRYFNRELSWIAFNERVLSESLRRDVPLLERLRFLCIVASNFDEFFMVRVASLKRQIRTGRRVHCPSGMSAEEQLREISLRVREIVKTKYECLLDDILPQLAEAGLVLKAPETYSQTQKKFLEELFQEEVFPVLTPVRCELGKPLPYTGNLRLHAAFLLRPLQGEDFLVPETGAEALAIVQIPAGIPRILYLPETRGTVSFALLEHVIRDHAAQLFPGYEITEDMFFRVTRDADLGVDEERDEDFVEAMEQVLESREHSMAIRMSINKSTGRLREMLTDALALNSSEVYMKTDPMDLSTFMELVDLPGFDHLRYEKWKPQDSPYLPEESSIWDALKKRDVLLHHPFESFAPVVRLVREAATDPSVLAIKMTLYRTSGSSPLVQALEVAAENGKQVTVLVELKARFDEEQNIEWAQRLERAGVIVVYGIVRLKVHAKAILIIRREEKGVTRYVHLGTGNYNDKTARVYTDLGFMTTQDELAYEIGLFFNSITGYSAIPALSKLVMAPTALKSRLLQMIDREAQRSTPENPGRIIAKINSLADPEVIEALYNASARGVQISLIIRGICMLVPGVPGMSENIAVTSVVGRYLEHSRIYFFHNGGAGEYYCGSADLMPRNLERRVELLFPIENPDLQKRIKSILETYLADNSQSHALRPDGVYVRRESESGEVSVGSQSVLYEAACNRASIAAPVNRKEFSVRRKPPQAKRLRR